MSEPVVPWRLDRYAPNARWRRILLTVLVTATGAFGAFLMWKVLAANGATVAELVFLAIFTLVFAWIALSFWSGLCGFVLGLLRLHPVTLRRRSPADGPVPALRERAAILIPVYNEDPADVCARLEANYRSLEATGRLDSFHFFMLSDTTDPEIARQFVTNFPDAELELLPRAGHAPWIDAPDHVADRVGSFLRGAPLAR